MTPPLCPGCLAGGTVSLSSPLTGGEMGEWVIDDTGAPALNRAAREWHADDFAELAANRMTSVVAFSKELVLPSDDLPSAVWVQRYPDGQPVETATGFGDKKSSRCAFAPPFRDSIKQAYEVDKVRWMAGYPFEVLSWPREACRYLEGNFNSGWRLSDPGSAGSPFG